MKANYTGLLCLILLLAGCGKPSAPQAVPLMGQVLVATKGGENMKFATVDVRVYAKSVFDAAFLEAKTKADEAQRSALEAVEKEREDLEDKIHRGQLEKEQTQAAKEAIMQTLSLTEDKIPADKYRQEIFSFIEQIDKIDKETKQDQEEIERIKAKEAEIKQTPSRDMLAKAVVDALPEPIQQTKADADGKFTVQLESGADYVIVANASYNEGGNAKSYRWTVPCTAGTTPVTVRLSNENLAGGDK